MSGTALLLIDVINDLAFDGSEALVAQAEPMALRLAALKRRTRAAGIPTIYINDNFGQWRSDFRQTVAHCTSLRVRRVIVTGIAGNVCVLFTANDAYMRDFHLFAPADCIVSNTAADNDYALRQIQTVLKGNIAESARQKFRRLEQKT